MATATIAAVPSQDSSTTARVEAELVSSNSGPSRAASTGNALTVTDRASTAATELNTCKA